MSIGQFISGCFSQIWRLFGLSVPDMGITFKDVFLGFIVISVSCFILKNLVSIGSASVSRFRGFLNKKYDKKG